ncbi:MAG: outer membrane beta-barrel protein [Verrucomicrobiota bacterium]
MLGIRIKRGDTPDGSDGRLGGVPAGWAVVLVALLVSGAGAQEGVSSDEGLVLPEDLVVGTFDLDRPSAEPIEASALFPIADSTGPQLFSSKDFQLGLDLSGVYDDNIFISSTDKVSDFIFRITPIVGFGAGDTVLREDSYVSVLYSPTGEIFTDNSDQNSFNQDLLLAVGYRFHKLKISYLGRYETLSDATADVGDRFDRRIYSNFLELAYDLSPKTRLIARGDAYNVKYKDRVDIERSDEWSVDVLLEYDLTDKTKLALGYGYGTLDVTPSSSIQRFHRGLVEAEWSFSDKITFLGTGGVEFRDFGASNATTGIYDLGFDYRLREGTEFGLRSYRRVEASAFTVDQDFVATGVNASFRQRLGRRWAFLLDAGYEWANYEDISGESEGPDRRDKVFYVRPSLAYSLREWMTFELFYRYEEDDSNFADFDYDNNQFGAQIRMEF